MRRVGRGAMNGGTLAGLVLALLMTPVLLWAAHPDPLWIPGVYDGGDTDDLVLTVLRAHGVEPPVDRVPVLALASGAAVDGQRCAGPACRPLPPTHPRAPPVSV